VKEGGAPEHGGLALQGVTAGRKRIFEGGERGEMRIDQRIVGELPQMLGGLELGRVRGQEDQMEARGDLHQRTDVLPRLIEHEDNPPGRTCPHRAGKRLQRHAHDRGSDGRGEQPLTAPGGGMDKGEQVEPLKAVLHPCDGPLPATRPDGAQDRLEAHTMLISGPDLDLGARIRRLHQRYLLAESVCTKAA